LWIRAAIFVGSPAPAPPASYKCIFGWGKQHGTMRKTKHRGIASVATDFLLNLIAYNLIRIPRDQVFKALKPPPKTKRTASTGPQKREQSVEQWLKL
jgi:hypothetical protein